MTIDIGQPAPEFSLQNQHGEQVELARARWDTSVMVVFYPFAFSGICSNELQQIRDGLDSFRGAEVVAISCDPMFTLRAFADQDGYPFSLLSDFWPHGEVASAYGVFDADKGCALRGTFLIDTDGVLRWKMVNPLSEARPMQAYVDALADLRATSAAS